MADKYSQTRYNYAPTISKSRTRFDLSHDILTTCNTGDLVPILVEPIYPGDTASLKTASLTRLETSLHQTIDNAFIEFAYFFVPCTQVWSHFDKFLGANDDPWYQSTVYSIPQIILGLDDGSEGEIKPMSLLNYIGVPAGVYGNDDDPDIDGLYSIDALPLRSIFKVYNDWFRDQNYDSVVYFDDGDDDAYLGGARYLFNGEYFDPAEETLKVNRFHDLFSTALPAPQKGQEVSLSLSNTQLPVELGIVSSGTSTNEPFFVGAGGSPLGGSNGANVTSSTDGVGVASAQAWFDPNGSLTVDLADATAVTVNQLRLAIATQAIAERDARGGTRLVERNLATWGVRTPALEIDRSELLGGKRFPISMMEVLQTSETGTTVLGHDAGHSKTLDVSDGFVKSFTNYGWLIGFAFMRTARSYSQGIDRKLRNKSKYDLYDPMLDNIGELAVLKQEIYALDKGANGKDVWGYQEPWYHLKERTNRFSGYYQTQISGSLSTWHYGDSYDQMPSISGSWLKETPNNVDRTIAVTSGASLAYQWTLNVHLDLKITRTMKKYPVPNTFGFGY